MTKRLQEALQKAFLSEIITITPDRLKKSVLELTTYSVPSINILNNILNEHFDVKEQQAPVAVTVSNTTNAELFDKSKVFTPNSLDISSQIDLLRSNVVRIAYTKKNGDYRPMYITRNADIISQFDTSEKAEQYVSELDLEAKVQQAITSGSIRVFDLTINEYRSYKPEGLLEVDTYKEMPSIAVLNPEGSWKELVDMEADARENNMKYFFEHNTLALDVEGNEQPVEEDTSLATSGLVANYKGIIKSGIKDPTTVDEETLIKDLKEHIVRLVFIKKDKSLRVMYGTRNYETIEQLLPSNNTVYTKKTELEEQQARQAEMNAGVIKLFDVTANGFRSFKPENLVSAESINAETPSWTPLTLTSNEWVTYANNDKAFEKAYSEIASNLEEPVLPEDNSPVDSLEETLNYNGEEEPVTVPETLNESSEVGETPKPISKKEEVIAKRIEVLTEYATTVDYAVYGIEAYRRFSKILKAVETLDEFKDDLDKGVVEVLNIDKEALLVKLAVNSADTKHIILINPLFVEDVVTGYSLFKEVSFYRTARTKPNYPTAMFSFTAHLKTIFDEGTLPKLTLNYEDTDVTRSKRLMEKLQSPQTVEMLNGLKYVTVEPNNNILKQGVVITVKGAEFVKVYVDTRYAYITKETPDGNKGFAEISRRVSSVTALQHLQAVQARHLAIFRGDEERREELVKVYTEILARPFNLRIQQP